MSVTKLYFDSDSINASKIMRQAPYQFVDVPENADVIWLRNGYNKQFEKLKSDQWLNHIPKQFAMTNKGYLTGYLNQYQKENPHRLYSPKSFYPQSIRLFVQREREQLLSQALTSEAMSSPWLLKRTNLSRGEGLHILANLKDLRAYYINGEMSELIETIGEEHYVLQRYITHLLLLNQRKSELRIYWLIASLEPLIVCVYNTGTARVCFESFKLDNFDNKLIHVANVYQQKRQAAFDPSFQSKWDFATLQAYLLENNFTKNPNYIDDVLMKNIGKALMCVVQSVKERLVIAPQTGHFFGLYGADFILDNALTPWLTEIQISPGLSFDDPIKQHVIPPMLVEAFAIVSEIHKKKMRGEAIKKIESCNKFNLVSNSF